MALAEVADQISADQRGIKYLLNALSAMGLLIKEGDLYSSNTPAAFNLLGKDSPTYIGHINSSAFFMEKQFKILQ